MSARMREPGMSARMRELGMSVRMREPGMSGTNPVELGVSSFPMGRGRR
jgi:hypothetical protein